MLRWRFSTGLLLGLAVGLPAGALIALLLQPPVRGHEEVELQLRQLARELEREKEARARADRQLEQFTEFAERMTVSFQKLEQRFAQLAEAAAATPTASSPETPAQGASD